MKIDDIVKFKNAIDAGDENLRMVLLENPDKGNVLVMALVDMKIKPTYRYDVKDLELCDEATDTANSLIVNYCKERQ